MKKLKITFLACSALLLLLSACQPTSEQNGPQTSAPVSPEPSASAQSEAEVSYNYWEYEDMFYHFKLKTPIWLNDAQKGLSYYIERRSQEEGVDDHAVILIAHYNSEQDEGLYDTSYFDTAENALYELQAGKIDTFFSGYSGGTLANAECTTTPCELDGREAVRYEGTYIMDIFDDQEVIGVTGYCVLGKDTPVLFCVMDFSDAQDKMDELAQIIDEMATTYVDGSLEEE